MVRDFFHYLIKNQVVFVFFLIIVGWLLLQIKSILISIFIAYIIMASLLPFVQYLRKKGVPRVLAAVIVYVSIVGLMVMLILPLVPYFISQVQTLILNLPSYINTAAESLGMEFNYSQLQGYFTQQIESIGANALLVTREVFGGLFSTLTILTVSFYLLLDHETWRHKVAEMFHKDQHKKIFETLKQVDEKLGAWLRGQVFLCFFIGTLTYALLVALQIPNALPLAVVAGLLEALPTLGPILSSIPAIIVAFTISPALAVATAVAYTFIQMLENNVIVPKIMQRAVGLNPVVVILAIMIGGTLMGVTGAILAIPFVSFLIVLFNSINNFREN